MFKYIIVGDSGCGKSCLLLRFTDRRFQSLHDLTIGVEFGAKHVTTTSGLTVKLQVWDTAGHESFQSITRSYYRGATVALLIYDVTRLESFDNIRKWLDDIGKMASTKITIVLIGNKIDLIHRREVSTEQGKKLAKEHGLLFWETSAKNDINVNTVFTESVNIVLDKILSDEIIEDSFCELGIKMGFGESFMQPQLEIYEQRKPNCCVIM